MGLREAEAQAESKDPRTLEPLRLAEEFQYTVDNQRALPGSNAARGEHPDALCRFEWCRGPSTARVD